MLPYFVFLVDQYISVSLAHSVPGRPYLAHLKPPLLCFMPLTGLNKRSLGRLQTCMMLCGSIWYA